MSPAPYQQRCSAFFIDALVALMPLWLVSPLLVFLGFSESAQSQLVAKGMLVLLLPVCLGVYIGLQLVQASRGKATPGRHVARISLSRADEDARPGFVRVLGRC